MPYIACTLGGAGLLIHFVISLGRVFAQEKRLTQANTIVVGQRRALPVERPRGVARFFQWGVALLVVVWLALGLGREFRSAGPDGGFDTQAFGRNCRCLTAGVSNRWTRWPATR